MPAHTLGNADVTFPRGLLLLQEHASMYVLVNMLLQCRAQMVQGGFMSIWERLAKKLPNVHTNINITRVDRRIEDPKRPITIT